MDSNDDSIIVVDSDDEKIDSSINDRSLNKGDNQSNNIIQETDDESEISDGHISISKYGNITLNSNGNSRTSSFIERNESNINVKSVEAHRNSGSNYDEEMDFSIQNHLRIKTTNQNIDDLDETYDSEIDDSLTDRKKTNQKLFNKSDSSTERLEKSRNSIKDHETKSDLEDNEKEESKTYASLLVTSDEEIEADGSSDSRNNEIVDSSDIAIDKSEMTSDESFIMMQKMPRKKNRILSDSEDNEITDDDQDPGRLTPIIKRGIRRSIFNMSRARFSDSEPEEGNSEEEADDDDENKNEVVHSDGINHSFRSENGNKNENRINRSGKIVELHSENENEDNEYKNKKKKKKNSFIISGYEEDDSGDQADQNENHESSNNASKISYESCSSNADEDKFISNLQNNKRNSVSGAEISKGRKSIQSDLNGSGDLSTKRVSDSYIIHEEHSVHQENAPSDVIEIDSATSTEDEREALPKKQLSELDEKELTETIQRLKQEVKRAQTFLMKGDVKLLPDSGKSLKDLIIGHSIKIKQYQKRLDEIQPPKKSDSSIILLDNSHDASLDMKQSDDSDFNPGNSYRSSPQKNSQKFNRTQMMKPTAETNLEGLGKKALETFQNEQALTIERLEHFHGSLLSRPTENERAEDPRGLLVPLMPHQQHALAWLLWREQQKPRGGVLADDMGLGKTLTTISLILKTLSEDSSDGEDSDEEWMGKGRQNQHRGGTLVVCPASLINQWKNEVEKRCRRGILAVEVYHGNNREKVARRLARNDMVITTYNLLSRESKNNGQVFQIRWKRVVLDEAHCIRNHKSQSCEAVCKLKATKRWALTGTPVHNKQMDIFAILKFLQCSPFDDLRVWKRWVENKSSTGVERLATVMKTLMLRRTKQELISKGEVESLPEKHLEVIKVKLDKEERLVYEKVMMYSKTIFAQFLHQRAEKETLQQLGAFSSTIDYRNTKFNKAQQKLLQYHANDVKSHQILVLLLRLRQICCQPALIHEMLDNEEMEMNGLEDDGLTSKMMRMNISISTSEHGDDDDEEEEIGVDHRVTENLLTSDNPVFESSRKSSKLRVIIDIVQEILEKKEKIIIVSQWTSYLNIIGNCLRKIPGASFDMFTGQVAVKNRQTIVDSFNDPRKKPQILLLSLCAGGVGLNLVGGNHLILVDIHWNPQLESQAQDRIYRFGQKKNVYIYKIICSDSIEERIQQLQERKMAIATSVLEGTSKAASKLTLQDLKSLFDM